MKAISFGLAVLCVWTATISAGKAQPQSSSNSSYSNWGREPWANSDFFPIAVWLQNTANAARYRAAGFNTYVALWKGPTESQLEELKKAGMHVICEQSPRALRFTNDPTIIGWMHGDEPDNAQALPGGGGWGPPIPPEQIVASYERMRATDPSRPVMLNLGQGVAWDGWHGRGIRSNHPEDYPKYIEGGDIVSFDIYPAVHDNKEIAGRLNYVARGVQRLVDWSEGRKIVWDCIECAHISNPDRKPTPHEVRAEVWMSLIHGSQGLIYFVHQFKPVFREAGLLDDAEMLDSVSALNHQISQLAPVLHEPNVTGEIALRTDQGTDAVAMMVKRHANGLYLFTVEMRGQSVVAEFSLNRAANGSTLQVLGENRSITAKDGHFQDRFEPWDVHLYRLGD